MGTNASYFLPREAAKYHDVMVVEGPDYESESGLVVTQRDDLNIVQVNETDLEKRVEGICQHIEAFKPDIIHIFYDHQALRMAKLLRKRYARQIKLLLDIRTPLLEERPRLRYRVQLKALLLQNAFDMIATHSPYSVKTIFPFCWCPVREVSYGVDVSSFTPRNSPWKKMQVDLVYTGAIAKKRYIDQLLYGFHTLLQREEAADFSFTLDLYGAGNRLDEMKELARHLEIEHKVVFHGLVDQRKLSGILKDHAIGVGYVPFGIYKQSPALKTLEYMCAGLSVLASDTSPTRDLISLGFDIETYDNTRDGFADGILVLCRKGWDDKSASKNLELIQQFDWREIVKKSLLPIYDELIKA